MHEFASVSASSYDPAALVARLNEKSADGWSVVSIVSTGGDVTAFLSRPVSAASGAASTASASVAPTTESAPTATVEPAGWAASPVTTEPAASQSASTTSVAQGAGQAQVAASTVPAQWAADPTGRYELRYWDGTRWTEHVSRAGQQYTDAL